MNNFYQFFLNSKEKSYFAVIEAHDDTVTVTLIDGEKYESILKKFSKNVTGLMNFLQTLIMKFQFKAVILQVFNCQYVSPYQNNHEFCQALKRMFMDAKIPTHFLTNEEWLFARILVQKNYVFQSNDIVSTLIITGEMGYVIDCNFTKYGYKTLFPHAFFITPTNIRKEVMKQNPKTVFLLTSGPACPTLMQLVKSSLSNATNLISCDEIEMTYQVMIDAVKRIADKNDSQIKFVPYNFINCVIRLNADQSPIVSIPVFADLPSKVTKFVYKRVQDIIVTVEGKTTAGKPITLFTSAPNPMAHQHEIILEIDKEHFVSYEVKPIILSQIKNLPQLLTKKNQLKVPVIGFLQNLSFICVRKNDKADYDFLQSWNGVYGRDLYLSFDKEKPSFGENAIRFLQTKPTYVVYDLIKIMSVSPKMLKIYKSESYKITEDFDNPVLLEFENYEGKQKLSTPAFLMALMLKEHFKAIKSELGEKPKEIGIVLFDRFDAIGRKRVETQLIEACEMLKVACSFVKV